jgi:type IV secretory pathway VirB6-like protein
VPLVAAGSTLYTQFVVQPVFGFPQWWEQYIVPTGGQFTPSSPAAPFDKVYASTTATEQQIWSEAHGLITDIKVAVALDGAKLLIVLSLGALFVPFAVLVLLSEVLVVIGPVLIPFALFQRTAFLFWNWVWATATILLSLFVIDIVLAMYSNVMNALITALGVTGTADNDIVGFWSAALIMVLLGFSVVYVPALVARIGTGVTVSMASASYYMSAGPVRDGVTRVLNAPSNMIQRWTGI